MVCTVLSIAIPKTTAARAQCICKQVRIEEAGLLNKCNRLDLTPHGLTDCQSQAIECAPGNTGKEYGLATAHADQALGRVSIIANRLNHPPNTILDGALIILGKREADIAGQNTNTDWLPKRLSVIPDPDFTLIKTNLG